MSVKRPVKVKIGPSVYRILWPEETPDGADWAGLTDHYALKMFVVSANNRLMQKEVLWHEIDHGIQYVYGIQATEMDGECQARVRGFGGVQVIRDNPSVMTWLMEK